MKLILLTRGKVALVDDEDYAALSAHKWQCSTKGSAVRNVRAGGKRTLLYMHRVLLNASDDYFVDHINGNTLDNRRSNLRLATQAQNQCNRGPQKNNTSGFKGVTFNKRCGAFAAKITVAGKRKFLGYFDTPQAAHTAYCIAAAAHHGAFARTS